MAFLTLEDLVGSVEVVVFPRDYEQYAKLLMEDGKIFVRGRASLEEDKDGKVICEQIVTFEEAAAAGGSPIFRNRYGGQARSIPAAGAEPAGGRPGQMKSLPSGLWIQFEDSESYQASEQELLKLLADSDGNDDVVIFLRSSKNIKVLPANRRVRADEELQKSLGEVFGRENIKIR
jgi:DNA polymerase-3 subunit alpha